MARLTTVGASLLAAAVGSGPKLEITKFVFANIPGLLHTDPEPETEPLPAPANVVFEGAPTAAGLIDNNRVTYSRMLTTDIGDFEFNWIGLVYTDPTEGDQLVMFAYVPITLKIKTAGATAGNVLTRNMVIEHLGIVNAVPVLVSAESWMFDYSSEYVKNSDPRLSDAREWTASTVTQAEAEAGTATNRRAWTAQRVRQAILAALGLRSVNTGTGLAGGGNLSADRTLSVKYGVTAGTACQGNDSRLSDDREWAASTVTQAEAEAGTATTRRAWTAQRVRQALLSSLGSRLISTGTGLTGGGNLSADRTLSVVFGATAGTACQGNDPRLSESKDWNASSVTQAEAEAGAASTDRKWSALRVRQAIISYVQATINKGPAATDSPDGNTLMQRNSSGDVWARLFRTSYTSLNANIGVIYTSTAVATDYIRPSTPAQVKTSLALQKADVGLPLVENRAFVWNFGAGTPTHVWASPGNSTTQYVYYPQQIVAASRQYVNANMTLADDKEYYVNGNRTVTLPQGSAVGTKIRLTKAVGSIVTIARGGSELIKHKKGTDTALILDVDCELILTRNSAGQWEI